MRRVARCSQPLREEAGWRPTRRAGPKVREADKERTNAGSEPGQIRRKNVDRVEIFGPVSPEAKAEGMLKTGSHRRW